MGGGLKTFERWYIMGMALTWFLATAVTTVALFECAAWRGESFERTRWIPRAPEPASIGREQFAGAR